MSESAGVTATESSASAANVSPRFVESTFHL